MSLLEQALAAPECVISVMGPHAGEDAPEIFHRKVQDCHAVGTTFWVAKSSKARPQHVQAVCASGQGYVLFVEPATAGGARPTSGSQAASEYSADQLAWQPLPAQVTRTIRLHEDANRELGDAGQYYDGESPGLGSAFVDEVEAGFARPL